MKLRESDPLAMFTFAAIYSLVAWAVIAIGTVVYFRGCK